MTYRIDFSSVAKAEADAAFLSFSQFTTPVSSEVIFGAAEVQEFPILHQ